MVQKASKWLLICIPFSLCFSQRLNGAVLLLYLLSVVLQPGPAGRLRRAIRQPWIYPFVLLYAVQAMSMLWTADIQHGVDVLATKSSLLVLPVLIAMDESVDNNTPGNAAAGLITGCLLALFYCLIYAGTGYLISGEPAIFFYHSLGRPLSQFNALYFSFYVFTALLFLKPASAGNPFPGSREFRIGAVLFMAAGLLLLSSRLFLLLAVGFFLFKLAESILQKGLSGRQSLMWMTLALLLAAGIWFSGFSRERFAQVWYSNFEVVKQEKFAWDTPFNGLTLRLLFLRFGLETLEDRGAWLTGEGVGDARSEMNARIISHNVYHGNPFRGDSGYLGYNFHNQFMELTVQSGIPALIAWTWLLVMAWRAAPPGDWRLPFLFFLVALILFALIEGVIERQRGVVFIAFFLSVFMKIDHYANQARSNN
ncbi:MAG TPA: hypothetical protein PKE06_07770 [Flavilitoribacter sp.]|nr:hypothetical protein [Flavilitoribacter sp.]HMQ88305.1 hypothetical protein [Flavilitoribacter sp.]